MLKRNVFLVVVLSILIPVVCMARFPGAMLRQMGTVEGKVFIDDKSLSNSVLAFFLTEKGLPPIAEGMRRVPEFLSVTDDTGDFKVRLMAGTYYIGILKRTPGTSFGPPREDEVFYFADDGYGKLYKFSIENFVEKKVGRIDGSLPDVFKEVADLFTLEGVLLEGDTQTPFEGAVVLAKANEKQPRPDFVSKLTGKDGRFFLKIPAEKKYYLTARQEINGFQPKPGDKIGTYGYNSFNSVLNVSGSGPGSPPPGIEDPDELVLVEESLQVGGSKGESMDGVIIRMYEVPDRQVLQAERREAAGAPVFETGAALNNLFFTTDSATLSKQSNAELDLWVEFLKNRQDINFELIGHTDNVGSEEYNLNLSERRAQSVAEYLVNKGISVRRIQVNAFGSSRPVAENTTPEGRRKNRRVEIKFAKQ